VLYYFLIFFTRELNLVLADSITHTHTHTLTGLHTYEAKNNNSEWKMRPEIKVTDARPKYENIKTDKKVSEQSRLSGQ
jgi:hypothetical protein